MSLPLKTKDILTGTLCGAVFILGNLVVIVLVVGSLFGTIALLHSGHYLLASSVFFVWFCVLSFFVGVVDQ